MHKKKIALLTASLLFAIACLSGCGEEESRLEVKEPEIIVVGEDSSGGAEGGAELRPAQGFFRG